MHSSRAIVFRWFFFISALELTMYYVVPALQFPPGYVFHIEVVSALTLGNVVAVFFLLVNIAGVILDRNWRGVYISLLVLSVVWLLLVVVTWSRVERWEFLLR